MADKEVYRVEADGGAGILTFFASGLPEGCNCEPGTGRVFCDDTVSKGIYKFDAYVKDAVGKSTNPVSLSFQIIGSSYEEFLNLVGDTLNVTFQGVMLCLGGCDANHDYTTYEQVDWSFVNGRAFELTKSSSLSSTDPGVGVVWTYQDPEPFIIKKNNSCDLDPYGEPSEQTISLDIQVKLRDSGTSYEFEIYINKDGNGGTIFHAVYDLNDPYSQIPYEIFHNSNIDCDENGSTLGSVVIATGGTATFSAIPPCVVIEPPVDITPTSTAANTPAFTTTPTSTAANTPAFTTTPTSTDTVLLNPLTQTMTKDDFGDE
jgi:hypothetical protein